MTTAYSCFQGNISTLTSYIDWKIIKEQFESSKKSGIAFYQEDFEHLLASMTDHSDFYIPSYVTMLEHIRKLQQRKSTTKIVSGAPFTTQEWSDIYKEFKASGQSLTEFFNANQMRFSRFGYSWFTKKMRLLSKQVNPELSAEKREQENEVKVIKLPAAALNKQVSVVHADSGSDLILKPIKSAAEQMTASRDSTVTVKVAQEFTISFITSSPEDAVLKIINGLRVK